MKAVEEVALRIENKPGTLSVISELLGANGINILALTIRAEGNVGMVNFVATDPSRVVNILKSAGYSPSVQQILAAETPHHPGGLNAVLKPLRRAGVNVEYLYSCIGFQGCGDRTILLLGVDKLAEAHDALEKEWIRLYGEEIYDL